MIARSRWLAIAAVLVVAVGCSQNRGLGTIGGALDSEHGRPSVTAPAAGPIRFASIAGRAGIDFTLTNHGKSPCTILDTSGGGCAFLDFQNDGRPGILLVGPQNLALYRNLGGCRFQDVTAASGLDRSRHWLGCAVGDYDGDGRPDIFLTGYRCYALYHNRAGGRFEDVTASSGIAGLEWSHSAAFADLTGHGRLDLFVSQHLHFGPDTEQICQVGAVKSACGPEIYQALSGKLFVNVDGQHFRAAPWHDSGKTWGALASDLLGTGVPVLFLTNDMVPCDLWERKGSSWSNIGPAGGAAYDGQGHLQGAMSVDSGDYDNDGRLDVFVTNYFAQPASLYHNDGGGLFTVTSGPTGIGPPTTPYVKFGAVFADLDNDGWLDLTITSGHVRDNVHDFDSSETYAQPVQVFHNERGRFRDCTAASGDAASERPVGRGLAIADIDGDGRQDVLICNREGKAVLLRNESPTRHWLDVRLEAPGQNRFALGSLVSLSAEGLKQIREIRTCGSVLSALYPVAHFGLGDTPGPATITVRWPDGARESESVSKIDATLIVRRGSAPAAAR